MQQKGLQIGSTAKPSLGNTSSKGVLTLLSLPWSELPSPRGSALQARTSEPAPGCLRSTGITALALTKHFIASTSQRSDPCQKHSALSSCTDRSSKLLFVPAWWMGIPSGSSRMTARRPTPKLFVSRPTREGIADRAFYAAPSIRHVEVATGIQHLGIAAWQSCQQLQIVKLPTSVVSLAEGTFMGCYVLHQVAAPGCVHYGQRVFAECCSLAALGSSAKQMTAASWHQARSLADMLLRVASRLQLSPLTRIVQINHEHCLKAHSVEQALSSCACRMTFTTSGRGPVKIAKV